MLTMMIFKMQSNLNSLKNIMMNTMMILKQHMKK